MLPEAPPGDAGLSLGSSVSTTLVLAHHALAALAATGYLVGIPGVVALVPPEYLRRQPDAPELMRRLAAIADNFNR